MMLKYIAVLVFVGIVNAIELQHAPLYKGLIKAAPIAYKTVEVEDGPAEYEFSYSVHDPHTGDIKGQKETRKGDVVVGSYELIDSDGHRRIVEYHADKHSGFNAIVHREPTDIKIPIPEQTKLIAHAPIHKVIASPIVHYAHAPTIAKVISPVAKLVGGSPAHGTHVSVVAPSFSYHY